MIIPLSQLRYVDKPEQTWGMHVRRWVRSNMVLKWEYKLGSVLYFVWTHNRTSDQKLSNMAQSENFNTLWHIPGKNVFMIKFNYWFTI